MGTLKFYTVGALFVYGAVQVMMAHPDVAFYQQVGLVLEGMGLLSVVTGLAYQLSRGVAETS